MSGVNKNIGVEGDPYDTPGVVKPAGPGMAKETYKRDNPSHKKKKKKKNSRRY